MSEGGWALRYAPHIGFRGRPLFADTVGSDDPVDHVRFIADQGFAGVQDPMAAGRSPDEQSRIGKAIAERGLMTGCFVYRASAAQASPLAWGALDQAGRDLALVGMLSSIEVAKRIGARHVAVLSALDHRTPKWVQLAAMADNLKPAADLAAKAGLKIVLEPTDARRLPGMLLNQLADAMAVIKMAGHPAVRLVFDTAHVQAMDGDLLANLRAVLDHVELVQLADHPGRVEPGAGEINFETFLAELHRLDFRGLCELEHLWSRPGADVEREGLANLRRLDAAAAARAAARPQT